MNGFYVSTKPNRWVRKVSEKQTWDKAEAAGEVSEEINKDEAGRIPARYCRRWPEAGTTTTLKQKWRPRHFRSVLPPLAGSRNCSNMDVGHFKILYLFCEEPHQNRYNTQK